MKIKQYKYEKVEVTEKDWEIPTEPKYFFETFIRRAIAVIPVFTTWNKEVYNKEEEIYELSIICVYQSSEAKIEKFDVAVSRIEDLYYRESKGEGEGSIIKFLIDDCKPWEDKDKNGVITTGVYCSRTKEQFEADFKNCLNSINEHLKLV